MDIVLHNRKGKDRLAGLLDCWLNTQTATDKRCTTKISRHANMSLRTAMRPDRCRRRCGRPTYCPVQRLHFASMRCDRRSRNLAMHCQPSIPSQMMDAPAVPVCARHRAKGALASHGPPTTRAPPSQQSVQAPGGRTSASRWQWGRMSPGGMLCKSSVGCEEHSPRRHLTRRVPRQLRGECAGATSAASH